MSATRSTFLWSLPHPDDEGAVKNAVSGPRDRTTCIVVGGGGFWSRGGGSGGNAYRREHCPAWRLAEIDARQACAKLGIAKVWFPRRKRTASQNVLNSLANWGHGQRSSKKWCAIVLLTRPKLIITLLRNLYRRKSRRPSTAVVAGNGSVHL